MNDKHLSYYNANDQRRHGNHLHRSKENMTSSDKMQPVLLDMLTDDEPLKTQEASACNFVLYSEMRRCVLRDLQWLFNCVNNEHNKELGSFPQVRRSTLNYGCTSLAGKRMSEVEWSDIQAALTNSILHFEPRILPDGLQVRCISDANSLELHNVLSIEIKGRLWCVPYPLEFLFRTEVDLENGHFDLKDIG
ncbi:type VI secretion system baseplate subunit TssE [Brucella gallinifaecis]|uniref:Type VI secretion system baseplate subunit TssE n=1 Tax=Brucella gallinifaecis TaxID=215590 RepID=A0A502BKM0_9HYPH|nr:GPW/gp25 family protein [Brucella gallinifaecis]TPF74018.1 type VI secretion system baseplate subunit TssE [Brucella gallinifaecis]